MPDRNDEVNLLIVDDLPENLLALDALLQAPGVRVHQAESAEQALELLLRHEFALAILDVQMPGMDGFQLAELMRGTERTKQIPIVFVSAAGRELNYAFKGYESGAVDFMQKPLDAHAVRSKVSVFVDLYRGRKRLIVGTSYGSALSISCWHSESPYTVVSTGCPDSGKRLWSWSISRIRTAC